MRSKPGDEDQVPDHVDEAVETVENTETVEENTPSDTIIVDENYEDEIDEEALLQQKMRQRHVASVRNKVYIFVLWVVLFMFQPMFLVPIEEVRGTWAFSVSITDPINSMFRWRGEWWLLTEIDELEEEQASIQENIDIVAAEIKVIENLSDQEKQNTLINCLNGESCANIDEALFRRIDFLRIFIMINELISEKMNFNQKEILRNIYEFMLTNDEWQRLGSLESIMFWSLEISDDSLWLVSLPITIWVTFVWKEPILTFLDNVENRVFMETPIMYVINSMNYDIVWYTEEQSVEVSLTAYFFASDEQMELLKSAE